MPAAVAMAAAAGGVAGCAAAWAALAGARGRAVHKRLHDQATGGVRESAPVLAGGLHGLLVRRACDLSREGAPPPAGWLMVRMGALQAAALPAGLAARATRAGLARTRAQATAAFALAFALAGSLLSWQLAVAGAVVGALWGWRALPRALRAEAAARKRMLEGHLSQAIEVICLGLRSGLSFDRALQLYCSCFPGALASQLSLAQAEWTSGLRTREEALREVQASYGSALFGRVVDGIVRSMRFGSPLADVLDALAAEARATHKAAVEEAVMKAPVKMMVPVGVLILPSMLLLVLGPVMLGLLE